MMVSKLLLYSAELSALGILVALLFRFRVPEKLCWLVAGFGLVVYAVLPLLDPLDSNDIRIFWQAGRAIWDGHSPYSNPLFLNPPFTLPLFAVLGLFPFSVLVWLWLGFNLVASASLVFLARNILRAQEPTSDEGLTPPTLAVLTSVVVLSFANRYGLTLGQLSIYTAFALYLALLAQAHHRPVAASVGLSLGAVKTGTMIPFLLLFLRKPDLRTWITGAVLAVLFCVIVTHPTHLVESTRQCLANIRSHAVGGMNDYTYANPSTAEIIALDHALYRLGLRDRSLIQIVQLGILATLGLWIGFASFGRIGRAALCSLVCFYSSLFLYHRFYDMVILALPLAYCTGRALSISSRRRWVYVYCVFAVLGILYFRVGNIRTLTQYSVEHPGLTATLIQALVLPYPVWLILSSMGCLSIVELRPKT